MRAKLLLLTGLCLLFFTAPATAQTEVRESRSGVTYSIRVPANYDPANGGLLVIGLHGQGGSHTGFIRSVAQAGYLSDAVVAAPNAQKGAAWEAADVEPVADMIAELRGQYRAFRVIAFGYSRGAYFGFGLGVRHPELLQAVVAHSGGLVTPVPNNEAVKKQVFYVIHGDADHTVAVTQSREAVEKLKKAGITRIKYDEIPGLGHDMDPAAIRRGFDWIEQTLGPVVAPLSAKEALTRIKAIESAVKAKEYDAAAAGFGELGGAPGSVLKKIAKLTKKHVRSKSEGLAVAAAEAAAALGELGLASLKSGLSSKSEPVAVASAAGLGRVGGKVSIGLLIGKLGKVERAGDTPELEKSIHASLERLTSRRFSSYKVWRAWAKGNV